MFVSSVVVIGNYSELNPKGCGFSRLTSQERGNCFEWHKDLLPQLRNGRNVIVGEAPWTCLIFASGVPKKYINDQGCSRGCLSPPGVENFGKTPLT